MKLISAHVTEYKSIWDSEELNIGEITCLVGKNEAGKTALLEAIHKINPVLSGQSEFDVIDDYPRSYVSDYEEEVREGERNPATVVEGTFELEDGDKVGAEAVFGSDVFTQDSLTLTRYYPNPDAADWKTKTFSLSVNALTAITFFLKNSEIPSSLLESVLEKKDNAHLILSTLEEAEATEETKRLIGVFSKIVSRGMNGYIYDNYIQARVPKFLYFDEYYQMRGHENIEALIQRRDNDELEASDHPMLGLIGLAGIDFESLTDVQRTQELKNKLEGAGNRLSRKVLQYWSQNKHVQMRFDVRPARPEDPEGMRSGSNIWADIYDSRHMVSTNLGTRSKGFVWFFSFLAWYSQVQRDYKSENVILLLDEPGLFLHGRAQEDLLKYFDEELKGKHQVVYTTHSPFMVDSTKFDRVRIVQDKGIDYDRELPRGEDGTKVVTEVLEASDDSLFPLQGALGYEIYQTLFVGPYCLVVEGVSDLLYLQAISGLLEKNQREGLDERWTITPVGGSDKVPTFVALLRGQKKLKVATLIDFQRKDAQTIENLYKKRILNKKHVLTYVDFTGSKEADVEDMFGDDFFLKLVNLEFGSELGGEIKNEDLTKKHPRVLVRLEAYLKRKLNHYRPARYFTEKLSELEADIPTDALDRFEAAFKKLNSMI